jgi:hypothetical protein
MQQYVPSTHAAQLHLDEPHIAEKLDALPTDWARYVFCRKRAESLRTEYFDEERSYVASVLATKTAQYAGMSKSQRITQAEIKWETSTKAGSLIASEQMWQNWAQCYLAAWQARSLQQLNVTLANLVNALRANEQ